MKFDPHKHHRRSIRLRGYDYSQAGAYFVTICTHRRACVPGEVQEGEMRPNRAGRLVRAAWNDLPNHYPRVMLDAFVVMPNHIHGIIVLQDAQEHADVGAGFEHGTIVGDRSGAEREASPADGGAKPAPTHGGAKQVELGENADVGAGFVRSTEVGDRSGAEREATTADGEAKPAPTHANTKRHGLPEIVRAVKTFSARRINHLRGTPGVPVWQRNYYERVIRNERELHAIQQYILDNPANWDKDSENPASQGRGN
jgi:putative transposase